VEFQDHRVSKVYKEMQESKALPAHKAIRDLKAKKETRAI
jgi:hypothetical protein